MEPITEAKIIGKYLIGKNINNQAIALYQDAIAQHSFKPDNKDQRIESLVFKHTFLMGIVDGGMALALKQSVLRKKIYLMLAILETIPEYSNMYLSENYSFTEFVKILFIGIRGVFRGVLGYILIKLI